MLVQEMRYAEFGLPLARFAQWAWASFRLAALAALLATGLALALGFRAARRRAVPGRGLLRPAAGLLAPGLRGAGRGGGGGRAGCRWGWCNRRWPSAAGGDRWSPAPSSALMLAYLSRFSAVALQSVQAGYARISPNVDETARLLGAGRGRLFWRLHLPLLQRSALAAALLVFVDVMKELPATLVLRPFGSDTLAVVAYNFARDERLGEAALPSLAIVAVGPDPGAAAVGGDARTGGVKSADPGGGPPDRNRTCICRLGGGCSIR